MPEEMNEPSNASISYQLAVIATTQKTMQRSLDRLEAAVLGNPEADSPGLLSRVSVVEDRAEEANRRASNSGKTAAGGGIAAIIAIALPMLKELLGAK